MTELADFILVVHFGFVLFVVFGLFLIWIGAALRWRWVRNFWFRLTHLAAILFVAGESVVGMVCPLTAWEDALRGSATHASFVQHWVGRILYYNFPAWVFTTGYLLFALAVLITFFRIKPERP
ncbi:MAG TPA: DUF2784 domain-containing protein [Burkholderiales bacterium]|nr:DUF2784 domain-containing protein [Burkholderiales bacterium]